MNTRRQRLELDRFLLGDVLGVGTVGTIFSAVDRVTGQPVAVKRLQPAVGRDPLIRARFRREMKVLRRLIHPHIVRYYGSGEDQEGSLFYVMEQISSGSLREVLDRRGVLPWQAVARVGIEISSALQSAHNHGVIHRDIKPGNLYITRDGVAKLGDFGIARDVRSSDLTAVGMTVGTHAYMAPEQIMGDPELSGKADLYSLGCSLFELLTGEKPYRGRTFPQLFEQHLRAAVPRPTALIDDCPPQLDDLVVQLLAKQPAERPFNARQVQGQLMQLFPEDDADLGKQQLLELL